jgi:hypothetical protein
LLALILRRTPFRFCDLFGLGFFVGRLFGQSQGYQARGLGTFGVAIGIIFGHGLGAFSDSLRLLELCVCPFAFLRVVGQRLAPLLLARVSLSTLFSAIAAGDLLHKINDPAPQVGILDPHERFD